MKFAMIRILTAISILASFIGASVIVQPVQAVTKGLLYVVQQDDTIYSISLMFHTSVYRLEIRNYLSDNSVISPGSKLYIPGFDDLSGTLTPVKIGIGDTPLSLLRGNRSDSSIFNRINFLTSPDSVIVGQKMFTINTDQPANLRVPVTDGGLTGLEMAAQAGTNPWTAAEYNSLPGTWYLIPNDILYLPASTGSASNEILPGVQQITSNALLQGQTSTITAAGSNVPLLKANFDFTVKDVDKMQSDAANSIKDSVTPYKEEVHTLNFSQQTDGTYKALQGVPRMTVPGVTRLNLSIQTADGKNYAIDQNMTVKQEEYGYDTPLQVADNEVDPTVTIPEEEAIFKIVAPATDSNLWNGAFTPPTETPTCIVDTYGRLRSFNESDWIYWHSGLDYCGAEGAKIFAAADGTVVYVGELTVRGNATIIDHGQGVYTGYYHQSKTEVTVGEKVKAGQEIGLIGATGRVTGPHLHFDVFIGGVQVDPEQWLPAVTPQN
jgi:murein DD-endopeptidase MepM/ murein hydrolase activator NlpD